MRVEDRPKQIEFIVIPFIIMGKKKFDSTHGVDRNRTLKKKRLDEKVEKVYIYIYLCYLFIYILNDIYIYIYIKRCMYIYLIDK